MKETVYETYAAEETYALGKRIGEQALAGEVYTLMGDLGVGKTVFTQGIAEGLPDNRGGMQSDLYNRAGL